MKAFRSRAFKYCWDLQFPSPIDETLAVIHTNSGQALTKRTVAAKARRDDKATREIDKP